MPHNQEMPNFMNHCQFGLIVEMTDYDALRSAFIAVFDCPVCPITLARTTTVGSVPSLCTCRLRQLLNERESRRPETDSKRSPERL